MATLTLTYPDGQAQALLDAICWKYGYADRVPNANNVSIPNPESRPAFAKRMLAEHVRAIHREHREELAARAHPPIVDIPIT